MFRASSNRISVDRFPIADYHLPASPSIIVWTIISLVLLFGANTTHAQVSNNNIEGRLQLEFNKPLHSSTAGADVQWKCINKALTNKCLVYHNDQWFSFRTGESGIFFLNIASQKCRDKQGVQLIIIEGNPCEVESYKILQCIPQIRTEDVFVELGNLKTNTEYLINVDGFLGDYCEFDLELSDRPKGLPRQPQNLDALKIESRMENKIVSMDWTIDENMAKELTTFRIVRQLNRQRAEVVGEISMGRNAYGLGSNKYQFTDTLESMGNYRYDIYGIRGSDDMPVLLSERKFTVETKKINPPENRIVKVLPVRMNFKEDAKFQLRLYNYDGDELLWKHSGESQGEGELFMIDPQPYVQYGLRKFQLLVLDAAGNKIEEIYFRVDGNGNVVRE
jgi:hypothetical protein